MEMEKLVSLCKRRGFLFQSSEIYGGLNGFWDPSSSIWNRIMPNETPHTAPAETPRALKVFVFLIGVGLVADVIDVFAYWHYLSTKGISFWETPDWTLLWEYITGFPGALLTLLGVAPWLIMLVWVWWPRRD